MKWTIALVMGWLACGGVARADLDGTLDPSRCDVVPRIDDALRARALFESAESETPPDSAATDVSAPVPPATTAAPDRPPGLGTRARRTVQAFASDLGYVAAAPLRLQRSSVLWLGGILATGAVFYANDEEILRAVRRNRDEPVMKQILHVGDGLEPLGFMGKTNPYYAGALALGYAFGVKPLQRIPAEILESHLIAGGLRNIAKPLVGRKHPYEKAGASAFDFGNGTSFPSGHTSVAYELATIASRHARSLPVTIAAYSLATTLALQRIDSLNHWPSDVFIPAVTGTLIARAVVQRNQERRAAAGALVIPLISPDGRLLGVRMTRTF